MSDEKAHCEAVARDVCVYLSAESDGDEFRFFADLLMAERAGLLARAEAAETSCKRLERNVLDYEHRITDYHKTVGKVCGQRDAFEVEARDLRAKLAAADLDLKVMREDRDALLQRPLTCTLQEAIARAEKAEAAAGQMRACIAHVPTRPDSVLDAEVRSALATDAGRDYLSPEQVAQVCAAARDAAAEVVHDNALALDLCADSEASYASRVLVEVKGIIRALKVTR